MNLAQLDRRNWQWLAIISAALAGGCAGWISWGLSGGNWFSVAPSFLLGGLIVGPLTALLGSVNLKLNELQRRIQRSHISLREMINIRPLISGPPLDYGHWAIDPFLAKVLAQLIYRYEPNHIVECGSGTSTVFMGQLLQKVNGTGNVTALEHLSKYAEKSEQLLLTHDLQNMAEIVHAPLEKFHVDGKRLSWYGVNPNRFSEDPIDILVVDGPPHSTGPWARYPALFVLREHLSDNCVIVLDDGDRPEEEKTAQRWADLMDFKVDYLGGPKGTHVLRRPAEFGD